MGLTESSAMTENHTSQQTVPVVRKSVPLAPIAVPKASDVLADALRAQILAGDYPEHTALPSERDLVASAQISRTSVREALRILEAQGFVRIKTGRAGGAFVRIPGEETVARTVSMFIQGRKVRMASLLETREAIEPTLARLAARHRTGEDLGRLDAANEAMASSDDSLASFLQANVDWHVSVAQASNNELLLGIMVALSRAIYLSTENRRFVDDDVRGGTMRAHAAVTEAIRNRDEDAAVRRMGRHLHEYTSALTLVEEREEIEVPSD